MNAHNNRNCQNLGIFVCDSSPIWSCKRSTLSNRIYRVSRVVCSILHCTVNRTRICDEAFIYLYLNGSEVLSKRRRLLWNESLYILSSGSDTTAIQAVLSSLFRLIFLSV